MVTLPSTTASPVADIFFFTFFEELSGSFLLKRFETMKTPLSPASVNNFTPVRGAAATLPKPNMSTSKDALMSSDLELQTGIGEWKPVHVEVS
ncbi:MAG: hypothetical protein K2Z81_06425 [Cyanobacteria bacterium]|nr:hypothetical protein [Cyanobacteriota bacterium]